MELGVIIIFAQLNGSLAVKSLRNLCFSKLMCYSIYILSYWFIVSISTKRLCNNSCESSTEWRHAVLNKLFRCLFVPSQTYLTTAGVFLTLRAFVRKHTIAEIITALYQVPIWSARSRGADWFLSARVCRHHAPTTTPDWLAQSTTPTGGGQKWEEWDGNVQDCILPY